MEVLYIDGAKVDIFGNNIPFKYSSNILRTFDKLRKSHSFTIQLPKTANNIRAFGGFGAFSSLEEWSEKPHFADVERDGILFVKRARVLIGEVTEEMINISLSLEDFAGIEKLKNYTLRDLSGDNASFEAVWGSDGVKQSIFAYNDGSKGERNNIPSIKAQELVKEILISAELVTTENYFVVNSEGHEAPIVPARGVIPLLSANGYKFTYQAKSNNQLGALVGASLTQPLTAEEQKIDLGDVRFWRKEQGAQKWFHVGGGSGFRFAMKGNITFCFEFTERVLAKANSFVPLNTKSIPTPNRARLSILDVWFGFFSGSGLKEKEEPLRVVHSYLPKSTEQVTRALPFGGGIVYDYYTTLLHEVDVEFSFDKDINLTDGEILTFALQFKYDVNKLGKVGVHSFGWTNAGQAHNIGQGGQSIQVTDYEGVEFTAASDKATYYTAHPLRYFDVFGNLPKMKQIDFIKGIFQMEGIQAIPSPRGLQFLRLTDLLRRKGEAQDWSRYAVEEGAKWAQGVEGAQGVSFSYKENQRARVMESNSARIGGDIEDEKTTSSPFTDVATRAGKMYYPLYEYNDSNEQSFKPDDTALMICKEKNGVIIGGYSWAELIAENYGGWSYFFKKAKTLEITLHMPAIILRDMDFARPIYLEQFGAYFLILEITTRGDSQTAKLVKI